MADGAEHGVGGLGVETAGPDLGAQLGRRVLRRELGPVRPRLAHRLVGIGRGQDARRLRDGAARVALRIAGAVEPLAVLRRDRAERREQLRGAQHPLREVRVQPDALTLAGAQRAALVPDGVGHAEAAEVVDEPCTAQRADVGFRQSVDRSRLGGQVRHRARMAGEVGRFEVDVVRDRLERGVEALAGEDDGERGLGVDHGVPAFDRVELAEDLRRLRAEQGGERRVELLARALPCERDGAVDAAHPVRHLGVLRELDDASRQRDLLALHPVRPPAAVPRLVRAQQGELHSLLQLELLRQAGCHRRVVGEHVVQLAIPRRREREPYAQAVQRRSARSQPPQARRLGAHAGRRVVPFAWPSGRCRRRTTWPARGRRCGSPR